MATVQTHWYTKGGKNLVEAEIGWVTGPINVALMKAGWVPDQDATEVFADEAANEAAGVAYVAGGIVIPNRAVTVDGPTNETRLTGDPIEWANSTITTRGAIVYVNAGAKPVLGYIDFGVDRASDAGPFRIEWPAAVVLRTRAL